MASIKIANFKSLDDALKELKKKTQDILKECKTHRYFLSKGARRKEKLLKSQLRAKKAKRR